MDVAIGTSSRHGTRISRTHCRSLSLCLLQDFNGCGDIDDIDNDEPEVPSALRPGTGLGMSSGKGELDA